MAIVPIVVDPKRCAILELHACGSLNLDEKKVDWILNPTDFQALAIEYAIFDFGTGVVRHE